MFERLAAGDFSPALVNSVLLAAQPALPLLLLACFRQLLRARHMRPEFSLRKPEAAELERAVRLYNRACLRLDEIEESGRQLNSRWRAFFPLQSDFDRDAVDEREDLNAHVLHLRATIIRLRRVPLRRLRSWAHAISMRFALFRALAGYVAALAVFVPLLRSFDYLPWAHGLADSVHGILAWPLFDARLSAANAAGACLAAVIVALCYPARRAGLRRRFDLEFCVLKELAAMPPGQVVDRTAVNDEALKADYSTAADAPERWFTILGIDESANLDEVREAYKTLIKQTHPDRVHEMSPAIRKFAEGETKRINAAYQEALDCLGWQPAHLHAPEESADRCPSGAL